MFPSSYDPMTVKYRRTEKVVQQVKSMTLANIRQIMKLFSNLPDLTPDHFLPEFGITLGEFCVAYVVRQTKTK